MMHRALNILITAAVGLVGFIYAQAVLPSLEGKFYPVVEGTAIELIEPVGDTRSRIEGSFQKVRDCDFEDLRFFLGTPAAGARVDLVFEEGSKQRGQGWEDFGPWLVQLDAEQLNGRSFAIAYHRCHPFWITETIFYP